MQTYNVYFVAEYGTACQSSRMTHLGQFAPFVLSGVVAGTQREISEHLTQMEVAQK